MSVGRPSITIPTRSRCSRARMCPMSSSRGLTSCPRSARPSSSTSFGWILNRRSRACSIGCGPRSASEPASAAVEPAGLFEPPVALQRVAVLAMPGGVLGGGQQQAIAVAGLGVEVVLQQAEPELLVVRVVAELGGAVGQRLDERGAVEAGFEIEGGEVHRLVGAQREQRALQPLEELAGRQ